MRHIGVREQALFCAPRKRKPATDEPGGRAGRKRLKSGVPSGTGRSCAIARRATSASCPAGRSLRFARDRQTRATASHPTGGPEPWPLQAAPSRFPARRASTRGGFACGTRPRIGDRIMSRATSWWASRRRPARRSASCRAWAGSSTARSGCRASTSGPRASCRPTTARPRPLCSACAARWAPSGSRTGRARTGPGSGAIARSSRWPARARRRSSRSRRS